MVMALEMGGFRVESMHSLGQGGYGTVRAARVVATNERCACKVIDLLRMRRVAVDEEVRTLRLLSAHPNVINLMGYEVTPRYAYIFMELVPGGELFDRLIDAGKFSEKSASSFFGDLIAGLQHLHSRGVAHRDIKLENLLLKQSEDGDSAQVKIIDFGLSAVYSVSSTGEVVQTMLNEQCGSKSYAAPEVIQGAAYLGFPADIWSAGVCLFAMLAGFFPLDEATAADWRFRRLREAQGRGASTCETIFGLYNKPCPFSVEVTELLDGMLHINPVHRIGIPEIQRCTWMSPAFHGVPPPAAIAAAPAVAPAFLPTEEGQPAAQPAAAAQPETEMPAPRGSALEAQAGPETPWPVWEPALDQAIALPPPTQQPSLWNPLEEVGFSDNTLYRGVPLSYGFSFEMQQEPAGWEVDSMDPMMVSQEDLLPAFRCLSVKAPGRKSADAKHTGNVAGEARDGPVKLSRQVGICNFHQRNSPQST